jgi:taurine dioxygenase
VTFFGLILPARLSFYSWNAKIVAEPVHHIAFHDAPFDGRIGLEGNCSIMELLPLSCLGAEVRGFRFDVEPDEKTVNALRRALLAHHLLILRGTAPTPPQHIAFTRLFGAILQTASSRLRYLPDYPEIFCVSNSAGLGNTNAGLFWHSDGAFLVDPTPVSVLRIVQPTLDGCTLFSDLGAAHDRLDAADRNRLSGLYTRAPETGILQPLIRSHPVTGRAGLYVNLVPESKIVDKKGHEIEGVFEFIESHMSRQGSYYRHQWREGDVVVVDNFAAAHCATPAAPSSIRILHRTTVHSPSVWWRQQPPATRVSAPAGAWFGIQGIQVNSAARAGLTGSPHG